MGPAPPSTSPVTGHPVPSSYLHSSSAFFRDTSGRAILLRGVNFSGSSKAPLGQPSHQLENFWEDAESGNLSFVGRPLDLDDGSADTHLARLRAWGFNVLRFVFTWESLEHQGPGKYDLEYIEYLVKVLYKVKEWGFRVFMDPHQDVWSRFSGGSGAPLWTLYACGIDPRNITATYGALLHCEYPSAEDPKPNTFPGMIWGTNYTRLVSQTVFTLFFAGKTYAPKCIIDGVNIQDYLQGHFIDAVGALAKRLSEAPGLFDECIIGWDSMNEPGEGLVGHPDLAKLNPSLRLKKGPMPTPLEGMRLGMGEAVEVETWNFGAMGPSKGQKVIIDPKGKRLWLKPEDEASRGGGKWGWKRGEEWEMGNCIWAQHGVWEPTTGALLKPDYFTTLPSDPSHVVEFTDDFFTFHWMSYASTVRLHHPEAIHFIQAPVFHPPPRLPESFLKNRAASSPHYYDGLTLMTKHWNWFNADALGLIRGKYWSLMQAIKIGDKAIRQSIQDQLGILKDDTAEVLGQYPTLIGELGCPYDMDEKMAYGYVDGGKGEGDYSSQQKAWDCSLNATDGPNCLNYTSWTYVPDNSHQWGDLWNGEDLSLWSADDLATEVYHDESRDESVPTSAVESSGNDTLQDTSFTSLASSATLPVPLANPNKTLSPATIDSGEGVTSSLILDGARALPAVCRPFPVATVGTPSRIDFDIKSAVFRLSVRVGPEDVSDEKTYTEIYVPFAHYTSDLDLGSGSSTTSAPYTDSANTSRASLFPGTDKPKSSRSSTPSNVPQRPLELDVTINPSHGEVEIKGQYVRWYYPAPTALSSVFGISTGAGDAEYTIEISRNGGAIVRDEDSLNMPGGWNEVCPSSCNIA